MQNIKHRFDIRAVYVPVPQHPCSRRDVLHNFALILTGSAIGQLQRWKGQRQKCIAMGALLHCTGALCSAFSVAFLQKDIQRLVCSKWVAVIFHSKHGMSSEYQWIVFVVQIMRSLKDISILTGATRLYAWFQRWKGQEQRCITTRAWRHVRGGSVYFGLCTLSVKTSPSFCYRYFTLHRYPTCPQIVTFERNYVFSDYHSWYPCYQ